MILCCVGGGWFVIKLFKTRRCFSFMHKIHEDGVYVGVVWRRRKPSPDNPLFICTHFGFKVMQEEVGFHRIEVNLWLGWS